jgi:hypothetical protein
MRTLDGSVWGDEAKGGSPNLARSCPQTAAGKFNSQAADGLNPTHTCPW